MATEQRRDLRRSTRVPIRVRLEIKPLGVSYEGETIAVNLHGALVKTSARLEPGAAIAIHVQLTGKSADARVVHASRERPLEFGIGLDKPQNIWGISIGKSVVATHISGCRSRTRFPMDMCKV